MEALSITVLNKLDRADISQGTTDVWQKTVISDCVYRVDIVSNVANTVVSVGQTYQVLIPFDDKYLPYAEWKSLSETQRAGKYTLRPGDYIIIGTITESPTPSNIQTIRNKYKPNALEVKGFYEVQKRYGAKYRLRVSGI